MSQAFEFFAPEEAVPDAEAARAALQGCGLALHPAAPGYWCGEWSEPRSGARAVIDLGRPPLEEDHLHPPRAYAGWAPLGLRVQVPLLGPQWRALEAYALIERLLAALPGARALDVEDVPADAEGRPGPGPWDRARVCASWRRLQQAQIASRTDVARMAVAESLALWHWRRIRQPDWPLGAVVRDRATGRAHPLCLWRDPARPCPLPAAGLVCVRIGPSALVLRRRDLPPGAPLAEGGPALVEPPPFWPPALPAERFAACDDESWIDEEPVQPGAA